MTITKVFDYYGQMINYIREIQKIRKVAEYKVSLNQRTKKYTLTYTI